VQVLNCVIEIHHLSTAPGTAGAVWNYVVDDVGRRTKVTDPRGNVWKYEYDPRDRLKQITFPDNTFIQYAWGIHDELQHVIDEAGKFTFFSYDEAVRPFQVIDSEMGTTTFKYDAFSNLIELINPKNQKTTYKYDILNRPVEVEYPHTGFSGQPERFVYDPAGRLIQWQRGDGSIVAYAYDLADRLTDVGHVAAGGFAVHYEYDELNRRIKMVDPSGVTTWAYNDDSQVTFVSQDQPTRKTIQYKYDHDHQLSEIIDAESISTFYTWTSRHEMATASQDGRTFGYLYDLAGNLSSITIPMASSAT